MDNKQKKVFLFLKKLFAFYIGIFFIGSAILTLLTISIAVIGGVWLFIKGFPMGWEWGVGLGFYIALFLGGTFYFFVAGALRNLIILFSKSYSGTKNIIKANIALLSLTIVVSIPLSLWSSILIPTFLSLHHEYPQYITQYLSHIMAMSFPAIIFTSINRESTFIEADETFRTSGLLSSLTAYFIFNFYSLDMKSLFIISCCLFSFLYYSAAFHLFSSLKYYNVTE